MVIDQVRRLLAPSASRDWLGVLPLIISVLVIGLLLLTLLDLGSTLGRGTVEMVSSEVAKPVQVARGQNMGIASADLSGLALFGKAAKPVAHQATIREAPDTKLNLVLKGIAAGDDIYSGVAIIAKPGASDRYFVVGGQVFDLATLEEIYPDRVILSRNGRHEALRLPEQATVHTKGSTVNSTQRQARTDRSPRRVRPSETAGYVPPRATPTASAIRSLPQALPQDLVTDPWQLLAFEPQMQDGTVVGLKLNFGEDAEFLSRHGLHVGDVITEINGHHLTDDEGFIQALDELSESTTLMLAVTRGGQRIDVNVIKEQ